MRKQLTSKRQTIPLVLLVLAISTPAHAYIGPGAGIGAIGLTIALAVGLVLLLAGFIWYPLKRLMRSRKGKSKFASSDKST